MSNFKIAIPAAVTGFCALLAACSGNNTPLSNALSLEVPQDQIVSRTEFATGLSSSQFTVSDVVKNGQRTEWKVAANTGASYRCYLTSTKSLVGSVVSDAICTQSGGATYGAPAPTQPCNALLQAAGQC